MVDKERTNIVMKIIKWIIILSVLFISTPAIWKYVRNKSVNSRTNKEVVDNTIPPSLPSSPSQPIPTNTTIINPNTTLTPPSPTQTVKTVEREYIGNNDWEFMDTDSQGYKRYCPKRTDIATEWFNISIYDYVFQQDTDLYVEFQVRDEIIRLRILGDHSNMFIVDNQGRETEIDLDEYNKISKKSKNIRFIPTEYDGDLGKIVIKRK